VRIRPAALVAALGSAVLLAACSGTGSSSRAAPAPAAPALARPAAAPTTSTTAPTHRTYPGFVGVSGRQLELDGTAVPFVGVNAPEAASSDATGSWFCGAPIDVAALFASLAPHALVRVWFTQQAATDRNGERRWDGLDRVVHAAEASPQQPKLVVSLGTQSGDCDDGAWHGSAWYAGGWRHDHPAGLPETYERYVLDVVSRYAVSPAVAIWEPVNEPEASDCLAGYAGGGCYGHGTCPANAPSVLRAFLDTVGAEIHLVGPRQLVGTGALGGGQCGWAGPMDRLADSSPWVDVLSFHDYDATVLPSLLEYRLVEGTALDKPLLVGEAGVATGGNGCAGSDDRAAALRRKRAAALAAGAAGYLYWDYDQGRSAGCEYTILPGDPLLTSLGSI